MMLQSINKKKIYFYLLTLIFLSTSFNLNYILKIHNFNIIKKIQVNGLSNKEEKYLRNELKNYQNKNIFLINKKEILNILSIPNFIEEFSIKKILPSELIINVKKTNFLGKTYISEKEFYIGSNGKLTPKLRVNQEKDLPFVFGKFSVNEFLKLQKLLKEEKFELNNIKNYFYHKGRRWDLENKDGKLIMLPYKNIKKSLKNYKNLVDEKVISNQKVIDLRIENKIVLVNE